MTAPKTTRAMDQAMDWLIDLECANAEQRAEFEAWLAADPANREAFDRVQAIWNSDPLIHAAAALPLRKPSLVKRLRLHWKPLATAAVLLLSLTSFSNLPMRLQADHLTEVGERQRLQLEDGSNVMLNTHSAFSIEINNRQRIARLYQGKAFFDVAANHERPLEIVAVTGNYRLHSPVDVVRSLANITSAHLHALPDLMILN